VWAIAFSFFFNCSYLIKLEPYGPHEVAQSARITHNKAKITRSNPPLPLLCGYVKKKKKLGHYEIEAF
jgi:hypothetical protein